MQIHCGISKARAWLRTQGYGRNGKQTRNEGEKRRFAWDHRLVSSYLSDKLNTLTTSIVLVCLVSFFNGEGIPTPSIPNLPLYVCCPGRFLLRNVTYEKRGLGKVRESERTLSPLMELAISTWKTKWRKAAMILLLVLATLSPQFPLLGSNLVVTNEAQSNGFIGLNIRLKSTGTNFDLSRNKIYKYEASYDICRHSRIPLV